MNVPNQSYWSVKYYNIAKTEWYKQIQTMFCAVILIKLVLGKKISKVN